MRIFNNRSVFFSCSSDPLVLCYGRQEKYITCVIYLEKFLKTGPLASSSIY